MENLICRTRNPGTKYNRWEVQISALEREGIVNLRGGTYREKRILLRKREKSSKSGSFGGTYVYTHYRRCPPPPPRTAPIYYVMRSWVWTKLSTTAISLWLPVTINNYLSHLVPQMIILYFPAHCSFMDIPLLNLIIHFFLQNSSTISWYWHLKACYRYRWRKSFEEGH